MVDPVSALATATAAFNIIKKGFSVGKDIESMYGDVGRWMGACSDIGQAEKMSQKPPMFKKIFAGASVEEEALNAFAAKKKAQSMEKELRNFINLAHGPNAWNELLQMQGKIRKQRQEMIYKQQEKQRKMIEISSLAVVSILVVAFMIWVASAIANKARAHDLCEEFKTGYTICLNEGYDQAHASMFKHRFPKHERYISCKLAEYKPMRNNKNEIVGLHCRYRYPNKDSFTFSTYNKSCPEQLTCTVSN